MLYIESTEGGTRVKLHSHASEVLPQIVLTQGDHVKVSVSFAETTEASLTMRHEPKTIAGDVYLRLRLQGYDYNVSDILTGTTIKEGFLNLTHPELSCYLSCTNCCAPIAASLQCISIDEGAFDLEYPKGIVFELPVKLYPKAK